MGKGSKPNKKHDYGVNEEGFDVAISVEKYKEILLRSPLKVRTIVVMGSRARGDWKPWSDVDVLVVAENLPRGWSRSDVLQVLDDTVIKAEIEVRGFTPDEFLKLLEELSLTALDAMDEGVIVYDDGYWKEAKAKFEEVKKAYELRRIDIGWEALRTP